MSRRNPLVDAARVLSAVGIIAFHVSPAGSALRTSLYGAVSVFLVFSAYFAASVPKTDFIKLTKRLALPFAAWSAFYFVVAITVGNSESVFTGGDLIFGTFYHLWYLSFIFISISVYTVLTTRFKVSATGYYFLAGTTLVIQHILAELEPVTAGQLQYLSAIPAFLFGLGLYHSDNKTSTNISMLLSLLVGISLALSAGSQLQQMHSLGFVVGVLIAATSLRSNYSTKLTAVSKLAGLVPLALGVYLIHPFVILALTSIGVADASLLMFVLVTLVSFPTIGIAHRIPLLRFAL